MLCFKLMVKKRTLKLRKRRNSLLTFNCFLAVLVKKQYALQTEYLNWVSSYKLVAFFKKLRALYALSLPIKSFFLKLRAIESGTNNVLISATQTAFKDTKGSLLNRLFIGKDDLEVAKRNNWLSTHTTNLHACDHSLALADTFKNKVVSDLVYLKTSIPCFINYIPTANLTSNNLFLNMLFILLFL